MSLRDLGRLFGAYAALLLVVFIAVHHHASLSPITPVEIRSTWEKGRLVEQGKGPVVEKAIAESPISWGLLTAALVPARDGVRAELDGKTAWVTPDDLLSAQAYDYTPIIDPTFGVGTDESYILALLSMRLGVRADEVKSRAVLHRVRFDRPRPPIDGATLTREQVLEGIRGAAHFLAKNCDENGHFRYMIRATTNQTLSGYNWPRHSGTTFFLAQAAAMLDDPEVRYAALRAASLTRDTMMNKCGVNKCVSDQRTAEVGSTALTMIAFAELVTTGADPSFARPLGELAAFLRSQQRPDGELMHEYDRDRQKPNDVQRLYYSGEAALGLSRAHAVNGDPRDLEAAKRITAHLSGKGWNFFGSRYYYGEEHWTCQVVADLWDRAPDREAADFCLRWHEYQRALQRNDGDSAFDDDGSFGFGPFTSPRVTPASSRGEAAGAALRFVRHSPEQFGPELDRQLSNELDRALAFVLRQQLWTDMHLYADPDAVRGAIPGSPVDMDLRIDYAQHAGSMMVRWILLRDAAKTATK